jgi:hypothetical protein
MEDRLIKRIRSGTSVVAHEQWRTLDQSVEVELTSEAPEWPIEHALLDQRTSGWRAAAAGAQTISLVWRQPTTIRRIRLVCEEHTRARTQEFTLRAFTSDGEREIVRQQFTFWTPVAAVNRPTRHGVRQRGDGPLGVQRHHRILQRAIP